MLIASPKTKMNAIGPGVTAGLPTRGRSWPSSEYEGLVIWSPNSLDGGAFSAGADLQAMLPLFMSGGAKAIGPEEKKLQDVMLALRYAQVPTVAAVSGLALGGGCELALHCARRVANLESYIGLVEVGVGLIPGGGGLAYGARRAAEEQLGCAGGLPAALPEQVLHERRHRGRSPSRRIEARHMGYLLPSDPIVFNAHELLYVGGARGEGDVRRGLPARRRRRSFRVAGRAGLRHHRGAAGQHARRRLHLGARLPPRQDDRRRHVRRRCRSRHAGRRGTGSWRSSARRFIALLEHPKTQERIMGMMQTGKPVRN